MDHPIETPQYQSETFYRLFLRALECEDDFVEREEPVLFTRVPDPGVDQQDDSVSEV